MELETKPFVITVTTFTGIVYIVCAILVALAPVTSLKVANYVFHGFDLTKIPKEIAIPDIFYGFIVTIISTIVFALLFVYLLNIFHKKYGGK